MKGARLTHEKFFAAATALKQHKTKFESERPSYRHAANELGRLVGFPISTDSLSGLMKTADVNWKPKRMLDGSSKRYHSTDAICALTRAVMALYADLGKTPTQGLQRLYDLISKNSAEAVATNGHANGT